jgi:hypothetical protein
MFSAMANLSHFCISDAKWVETTNPTETELPETQSKKENVNKYAHVHNIHAPFKIIFHEFKPQYCQKIMIFHSETLN